MIYFLLILFSFRGYLGKSTFFEAQIYRKDQEIASFIISYFKEAPTKSVCYETISKNSSEELHSSIIIEKVLSNRVLYKTFCIKKCFEMIQSTYVVIFTDTLEGLM